MLEALVLLVFPFCMVYSAVSDLLSMRIANLVPIALVATFLLVAPLAGFTIEAIGWHLLAGIAVLSVTFVLFAVGGMGGGDAKLLAATAVWMGFGQASLEYLTNVALFGGFLTIGILVFRRSPLQMLAGRSMLLKNLGSGAKGVPYGIALGSAGLFTYLDSPLGAWAIGRLAS